jgi:hypothetical protein
MTTTTGNISLHSNGGTLVLASQEDAVSISSGTGDLVTISAGSGGLFLVTTGALTMPSLASATTSNILYYNSGTGQITQSPLFGGTYNVNSYTWTAVGGGTGAYYATIPVAGLVENQPISVTLQVEAVNVANVALCSACWIICSQALTNSMRIVCAGDPSTAGDAVLISLTT